MFHLDDFNTFDPSNEFTRFFVDTHLASESTRVVVSDRGFLFCLEVHVKAVLHQEFGCVHDLDAFEFVITGKGSEALSTRGHERVNT